MNNREVIAVALFTQLQTAGVVFKKYSRRPALWNGTNEADMPILYMGNTKENLSYSGNNDALALNELSYPITIYFKDALDPTTTPDTMLNTLLDAIDAAMQPPVYDTQQQQTLGGLVAYARRDGEVIRVPGYIDGQAGAYFEIKVLAPN